MIIPKKYEFYESFNAPNIVESELQTSTEHAMNHMTSTSISTSVGINNADDPGHEAEVRRNAYNAAFYELGLGWFWEAGCHHAGPAGERACVREYLAQHQPHLLTAYDADFLVDAILAAKERCAPQMAAGARPGAAIDWRELQQRQIGI
jgi:hypothetical protein